MKRIERNILPAAWFQTAEEASFDRRVALRCTLVSVPVLALVLLLRLRLPQWLLSALLVMVSLLALGSFLEMFRKALEEEGKPAGAHAGDRRREGFPVPASAPADGGDPLGARSF